MLKRAVTFVERNCPGNWKYAVYGPAFGLAAIGSLMAASLVVLLLLSGLQYAGIYV